MDEGLTQGLKREMYILNNNGEILLNDKNEIRSQKRNFEISTEVRYHDFAINTLVHTQNI